LCFWVIVLKGGVRGGVVGWGVGFGWGGRGGGGWLLFFGFGLGLSEVMFVCGVL